MRHKPLRAGAALLVLTAVASVAPGTTAPAQEAPTPAGPRPSLNLYGVTGLIDMPSAEEQPDGQVAASYTQFGTTQRRNFTFQFLPRLSATVRYSSIKDWGQTGDPEYELFDRSLDLQFQLLKEKGWQPSLALGFRDFLGTGVYSGEYLAVTKGLSTGSWGDFKVTGGVGWGRLASAGGTENPFCAIASSFCERNTEIGKGGTLDFDNFFHGEKLGYFGGVEWVTPIDKLTLKAEISSDAYTREQKSPATDFEVKSPFNFGAEYRLRPGVTLGGYYMYGSTFGFNVSLSANPMQPPVPQNLGAGPMPVNARSASANRSGAWVGDAGARDKLTKAIGEALDQEGLTLQQVAYEPSRVQVYVVNRRINQPPKAIGRTARVLAAGMPYSVENFDITLIESGLPTTTVTVNRTDLEQQVDRPNASVQSWDSVSMKGALPVLASGQIWSRDVYPLYDWALIPVPTIQIFGGNEGFKPQLTAQLRGSVKLSPGLSFSTLIRQPILGEFADPGPQPSSGNLPPVQSDSARYYAGWTPKLVRLSGDYLFKLNRDTYARASAGLLEREFGGVSGEVLWKPVEQNWGLGLELNYVAQRDFYSPFGFGYYDYQVAMGHASVYWDTGWMGIEAQLMAGRYLAGDWGGTLYLTRRFANGWAIGAFVTRTDVSADDFGEGSYDKGITVSIPLRWATPFETRQTVEGDLRSLASNGGATLDIPNRLYPIVRGLDEQGLERSWGSFWE